MSKKMTYLVAETRESIEGLSSTRLNETVNADKSKVKYSTGSIISTIFSWIVLFLSYHTHSYVYTYALVIGVLSTECRTQSQQSDSYSTMNLRIFRHPAVTCKI